MDRNLALNLCRVTESAALASAIWLGRGDASAADQAAVDAMRKVFETINVRGEIIIGEGEMDEAPMLYIGEKVGLHNDNSVAIDIAVDPLDGTSSVEKGLNDAISVVAAAPKGTMLKAPDTYMRKLAVGPKAKDVVDIRKTIGENIKAVAKALDKDVSEVTVTILERPRHDEIVEEIREIGARIVKFSDGDVLAAMLTCIEESGIDILYGTGGAPEGVLAAAALKCLDGGFQGILTPHNEEQKERALQMGCDLDKVYDIDELIQGESVIFAATGVSQGSLLDGVKYYGKNIATTESIVLRCETGTVRYVKARHQLDKKPEYTKI